MYPVASEAMSSASNPSTPPTQDREDRWLTKSQYAMLAESVLYGKETVIPTQEIIDRSWHECTRECSTSGEGANLKILMKGLPKGLELD